MTRHLYVVVALCAFAGVAVSGEPAPRFEATQRPLFATVVVGDCPAGKVRVKMPLGWDPNEPVPPRVRPTYRCILLAEGVFPVVGDDVKLEAVSGLPVAVDVRRPGSDVPSTSAIQKVRRKFGFPQSSGGDR